MITVVFNGSSHMALAKSMYQWDYGQVLRIQGLKLPSAVEVQFTFGDEDETITRIGTTINGATDVPVPDNVLEQVDQVYAYVYITNEDSGKTEYKVTIPIIPRAKPEAFERPEDREIFTDALLQLRENLDELQQVGKQVGKNAEKAESAKTDAETAAAAASEAQEKAEAARDDAVTAKVASEDAQRAAEAAQDHAEQTAATLGYAYCEIDTEGHLKMIKTDNTLLDLKLENGRLIQIWQ